jgi:hypothetical protein
MGKLKEFIDSKIGYFVQAELVYPGQPYDYRHTVTDVFSDFITADSFKSVINKVQPYIDVPPASAILRVYDYYKLQDGREYKQANRILYMNKNQCKQSWIEIKSKKTL